MRWLPPRLLRYAKVSCVLRLMLRTATVGLQMHLVESQRICRGTAGGRVSATLSVSPGRGWNCRYAKVLVALLALRHAVESGPPRRCRTVKRHTSCHGWPSGACSVSASRRGNDEDQANSFWVGARTSCNVAVCNHRARLCDDDFVGQQGDASS